jgi:response regulator of citrate/malate metabolism
VSVLKDYCQIVPAGSLAAARVALSKSRPGLVILDLALGDGSGLDLMPEPPCWRCGMRRTVGVQPCSIEAPAG